MEILAIVLTIIIFYEKYQHGKERSELLDRLMARDFGEFKERTEKTEENDYGEEDDSIVSVLDVNNDDKEEING